MDVRSVEEWKDLYIREHSLYQGFTERLEHLVQDLLEQVGIELFHVESRTKSIERFMQRIANPSASFRDPVNEMYDLSGVRVVLYFAEDLEKIARMVEEEFTVHKDFSVPYDALQDPDAYGYRSIHYAVSLAPHRATLREWRRYGEMKAEIQIRTILQNAWSAITKKLPYDEVVQSKSLLKRKLLRMSALLEEADEGFLSVWDFVRQGPLPPDSGGAGVSQPPKGPKPSGGVGGETSHSTGASPRFTQSRSGGDGISVQTLRLYFETHAQKLREWTAAAAEIGYPVSARSEEYEGKSLENLVAILSAADIASMEDFEAFLGEMEDGGIGRQHLRTIFRSFEKEIPQWRIDTYSLFFLLVLNAKWDVLQKKDLVQLGIKGATDRIKGAE
jgi:ppGpp synthetase/RelA/SpoT-type nucleotidyltranferase